LSNSLSPPTISLSPSYFDVLAKVAEDHLLDTGKESVNLKEGNDLLESQYGHGPVNSLEPRPKGNKINNNMVA
jgi:hypothetical protein